MAKTNCFRLIFPALLGFVIGGLVFAAIMHSESYTPPLKVLGDVAISLKLEDAHAVGKLEEISYKGEKYQAIKLADIINEARPVSKASQLYLIGSDGFTSAIKADEIEKSYIAFTAKNGWEAINLNHPMNSNAKMLREIVVVSDGSSKDSAFSVIKPETDLIRITPGQVYTRAITEYPYMEGKASVENNGKTYESLVYTRRKVFKLGDLTPVNEQDMLLLMGENGEYRLVNNQGYFELKDNYINYLQPNTRDTVEKLKGVIINPPTANIMDAYYDTRHFIESGKKVLLVILDGFSYHQYLHAIENGYAPFFQETSKALKVNGVYPIEINVWLAATITGKTPEENGIINAEKQDLTVASLFTDLDKLKKQALFIEADKKRLNTEVEPLSCRDKNASGTADDELFTMALENLDKEYDLLMLRFHSIANSTEDYGELSPQTLSSISTIDEYLSEIASKWSGKIIIAANQGNQSEDSAGAEGSFSCDGMFVPYLIISR